MNQEQERADAAYLSGMPCGLRRGAHPFCGGSRRVLKPDGRGHICRDGERVMCRQCSHGAFRQPGNSPGGIQAKHGKSEILYAAPVESCRGNGWHVQGDGVSKKGRSILAGKTLMQTRKLLVLSKKPAGSFRDNIGVSVFAYEKTVKING